jgi:DNA-binding transcriptional LysR family regulator
LEDELGGALFFQRPQVQLTTLGWVLRPHFRSIVKAIDKTPQIAAALFTKSQREDGGAPLSTR